MKIGMCFKSKRGIPLQVVVGAGCRNCHYDNNVCRWACTMILRRNERPECQPTTREDKTNALFRSICPSELEAWHNKDNQWFVVINNRIHSGWDYKSDAHDCRKELGNGKVYSRAFLKRTWGDV